MANPDNKSPSVAGASVVHSVDLSVGKVEFQFRKPTLDEFEDYQDKCMPGSKHRRGSANRELLQVCLLSPTFESGSIQKLFIEFPGMIVPFVDAVLASSGTDAQIVAKKG